jgi:predicted N-acetyltransferase YhbS
MTFEILPERPDDAVLIDPLLDRTFGPDRRARTVYRLRDGIAPQAGLSFAAVGPAGALLGSLRFWPISIEAAAAVLLGPLVVEPELQGRGIGRALVAHGVQEARRLGHEICVVVGEPGYYGPYGFIGAPAAGLHLPGPVEPRRFLVAELRAGALDAVSGMIGKVSPAPPAPAFSALPGTRRRPPCPG